MTLEEYGEMYVKGSGSSSPGEPEVPTSEDNENRYLKYCIIGIGKCEVPICYHRDFRLSHFCLQTMCREMSSGITFKK